MDEEHPVVRGLTDVPNARRARTTFLQVLPRRIVKYRELRAVSQSALAKAAHVSRSTLNMIESGHATDMKVSTLERLCHALGVSGDALLGYNSVLVRNPLLHGLSARGTDPALGVAHSCAICACKIGPRELHLPGDCMLELADNGATSTRIGALFGLRTDVVDWILFAEGRTRRLRR